MRQAQINVRTRACSRTSIARTKQAALTHNVRGKELMASSLWLLWGCYQPESYVYASVLLPNVADYYGDGL